MRNPLNSGELLRVRARPLAASLIVSALVAGCSTDVQRFGFTGSVSPSTGTAAVEPVETAPLASPAGASGGYGTDSMYRNASYSPDGPAASGGWVTVQPGDTAFSIAQQNGVSIQELAAANGLSYPYTINIGQRLTLPGGAAVAESSREPVRLASRGDGTHTVSSGDTLFNISQRYGVGVGALADANGLDDYGAIRIGQTLTIPSGSSLSAQGGPLTTVASAGEETDDRVLRARSVEEEEPGEETTVASADPTAAGIAITPPSVESRFRWPVRGRIISRYGVGPDGERNDGVNISVPEGASVKAAEDGVVAYAGDELAGYGNLILIRHSNDWVTAYAHNSEILVSRGDTVQRGQIIAKAGQTGSVDKPQVHFEIRQGSKAVDPMPYLEGA